VEEKREAFVNKDLSTQEEQAVIFEMLGKRVVEQLNKRGIHAKYAPDKEKALSMVMDIIPEEATVGTADSVTLLQVGVLSALKRRGRNEIINPFVRNEEGYFAVEREERDELMRQVLLSDVFVVGTNAVTLDGKLVNIDGYGNRVAAMIFGPRKVIIVVGANKIVKNAEEAVKRAREFCGPQNVIRHVTKHHRAHFLEVPCAKTGYCSDCNHPWRMCRYTTIIEGVLKSQEGRINVILVGETLGL
jgi:L-lactate utilization protein LutB